MTEYREDQLTDWFPPEIKPVHVGVYQTEWGYAYWKGNQWGCAYFATGHAREYPYYRDAHQDKRWHWRGLNFNPAEKKGGAA